MSNQDVKKNVPIYFYYLTISKEKDAKDNTTYGIDQIVDSFSAMLQRVLEKDLVSRRKDFKELEKVVWLDQVQDLKNGNYNIVFKSAKYNHVRNEIDTETMEELGTRKRKQDGDEEKTHLCIRFNKGQLRFLAVHESNHYGISIKCIVSILKIIFRKSLSHILCIVDYLNSQFCIYNEETEDKYHYTLSYEIMPGDDFLNSLKKARTVRAIKLIVSKDDIKDDFMSFAGREEISDEVEICLRRPKKAKKFPENLIKSYYEEMQSNNKIKRIIAVGTNHAGGQMDIDTDLIKMKHYLIVKIQSVTNEVESVDFFDQSQAFIDGMRR